MIDDYLNLSDRCNSCLSELPAQSRWILLDKLDLNETEILGACAKIYGQNIEFDHNALLCECIHPAKLASCLKYIDYVYYNSRGRRSHVFISNTLPEVFRSICQVGTVSLAIRTLSSLIPPALSKGAYMQGMTTRSADHNLTNIPMLLYILDSMQVIALFVVTMQKGLSLRRPTLKKDSMRCISSYGVSLAQIL